MSATALGASIASAGVVVAALSDSLLWQSIESLAARDDGESRELVATAQRVLSADELVLPLGREVARIRDAVGTIIGRSSVVPSVPQPTTTNQRQPGVVEQKGRVASLAEARRELDALRKRLDELERNGAAARLAALASDPLVLRRLKFERLGCDPLDEADDQNLAEQIDQQATYEVALDALQVLMERHPGKEWVFAPGAHGAGHDLVSHDGEVAAEVFAAVDPSNNDKLRRDIAKVGTFAGPHRYVFLRSPARPSGEQRLEAVVVVSLGM